MFQYKTFTNMKEKLSNSSILIKSEFNIDPSVTNRLLSSPRFSNGSIVEHKNKLFGLTSTDNIYIKNIEKKSIPAKNIAITKKYLNSELCINNNTNNNNNYPYTGIIEHSYANKSYILISKMKELYIYDTEFRLINTLTFDSVISNIYSTYGYIFIISKSAVYRLKNVDIETASSVHWTAPNKTLFTSFEQPADSVIKEIKIINNNNNIILFILFTDKYGIFKFSPDGYGNPESYNLVNNYHIFDSTEGGEYSSSYILYTNTGNIETTSLILLIINTTRNTYQYNIKYTVDHPQFIKITECISSTYGGYARLEKIGWSNTDTMQVTLDQAQKAVIDINNGTTSEHITVNDLNNKPIIGFAIKTSTPDDNLEYDVQFYNLLILSLFRL